MLKKYVGGFAKSFLSNAFIVVFLLFFVSANFDAVASGYVKRSSSGKQTSERVRNPDQWPFENSDLRPDPALVFKKLPNGFRYILMENHYPKNRVSMHLFIQAGSMDESDNQQGLAHFLEHMLFDGSTHFKPSELVKFFQNIGMQFGPDANAHTGFTETVYDILLPKGDEDSLKKGLLVMKDFAQGALLLPSEVEKERRVVLAEKRTRDSASYRTFTAQLNFEFPDARISRRLPIGKEEILKKAGQKQLKAFYDTWYRPKRMILILVGDFDPNSAEALIGRQFSAITPRAPPTADPDLGQVNHKGIIDLKHPLCIFSSENTGVPHLRRRGTAHDMRISAVVVNGFEIFGTDGEPRNIAVRHETSGNIADNVLNKFGVGVAFFGDLFFVNPF